MVCMINDYAIVTFYNDDIEDLELGTFLECLVKQGIKLLSQYIEADSMLCGHEDVICLYNSNGIMCFIITIKEIKFR